MRLDSNNDRYEFLFLLASTSLPIGSTRKYAITSVVECEYYNVNKSTGRNFENNYISKSQDVSPERHSVRSPTRVKASVVSWMRILTQPLSI